LDTVDNEEGGQVEIEKGVVAVCQVEVGKVRVFDLVSKREQRAWPSVDVVVARGKGVS